MAAESEWSLYSITVAPLIGWSVLQSLTVPVSTMLSILSPVEKARVKPGNMFPSLLSATAAFRSSV